MRLIEIEISKFRGIRHLTVHPDAKNLVLWGPNGSGKSAVVDAIDFLLTGEISRLKGTGTKYLSLAKHGPHVDFTASDAVVRALVKVSGFDEPFGISRCVASPGILVCDNDEAQQLLKRISSLARRKTHILTRREILRFITADGGDRATQIQEILNISELVDVRETLVKVRNSFRRSVAPAKSSVDRARSDVVAALDLQSGEDTAILDAVNLLRDSLGGQPVRHFESKTLKRDIAFLASADASKTTNIQIIRRDVDRLGKFCDATNIENWISGLADLDAACRELRESPEL